jgi:hypothetical protein
MCVNCDRRRVNSKNNWLEVLLRFDFASGYDMRYFRENRRGTPQLSVHHTCLFKTDRAFHKDKKKGKRP